MAQSLKDRIRHWITKPRSENEPGRMLAVIPDSQSSLKMFFFNAFGLVKECIDQGESHDLRFRTGDDGAEQTRHSFGKFWVDLPPQLIGLLCPLDFSDCGSFPQGISNPGSQFVQKRRIWLAAVG